MDDRRDALAAAHTRPDDVLLTDLAAELFGDDVGALPGPGRADRARRWLDRFLDERRDELCHASAVEQLLDEEKFDELEEAVAIAAAVGDIAGLEGSGLVAAAVLIVRRGLRAICARA